MFWKILGIACGAAAVGGLVAGIVIETKKHKNDTKNAKNKVVATTQA